MNLLSSTIITGLQTKLTFGGRRLGALLRGKVPGLCLSILFAIIANPCGAQQAPGIPEKGSHWVGTWAASPQATDPANLPPAPGLADTTLRQIVRVTMGGKQVRVRFSNAFGAYGNAGLTIHSARVAASAGGSAITSRTDRALTFHGKTSVTIPRGAVMISDPVDFDLAPLFDLAVTIHITDASKDVTGHAGSRCTSYLQPGDSVSVVDMPAAATITHWYYLSGVDVLAPDAAAAVAVLGDSITDGRGSTTDANRRWTDHLARRLRANPDTAHVAVVNEGIGGNCLRQGGLAQPGLVRLDRDVLSQPGVRWLLVLEGINDLAGKAPAEDVIASLEQIIMRARDRNIVVLGATLMPCGGSGYLTPEAEAARQTVNHWIRTSGVFDAVIDMDAATGDPNDPTRLAPAADSGDHLHPNDEGYRIMADAVDLKLFATHQP